LLLSGLGRLRSTLPLRHAFGDHSGSVLFFLENYMFHSIMKCDINISQALYANVVASGGTMFGGMGELITKELIHYTRI
jgi:actin-related protein